MLREISLIFLSIYRNSNELFFNLKNCEIMNKVKCVISKDFEDIMPEYLESIRKHITSMKSAVLEKKFTPIKETCHKIKGNAGGFGFTQLGDIARNIENAAQENNCKKIQQLLLEAETHLDSLEIEYE